MQKKEKVYDYFVSFYFETKKSQCGWGDCHIPMNEKITNYGVLREMSNRIKEQENLKQVVILNFILMK